MKAIVYDFEACVGNKSGESRIFNACLIPVNINSKTHEITKGLNKRRSQFSIWIGETVELRVLSPTLKANEGKVITFEYYRQIVACTA